MITEVRLKKDFFRNKAGGGVFIFCFPMLPAYQDAILMDPKRYWAKISIFARKGRLQTKGCLKFVSKWGTLYLVCSKIAEYGNASESSRRFLEISGMIEGIRLNKKVPVRVHLRSFVGTDRSMSFLLQSFLASSKNKFELYI